MKQDDCYQLGEVIKTHGLSGEVSVHLDVDFPDDYQKLESVFLEQKGKLILFFITSISINNGKARIHFEDIESIEEAKNLVKSKIFLPLSLLPTLKKGQYYFHDLIGCKVYENKTKIGIIKNVIDLRGNQLLAIDSEGDEILLPLKEELLTDVDLSTKKISVILPEGLIDIYKISK